MYADDTSLCYPSHDLTSLNGAFDSDLKELNTWLQGNRLSLNVVKTHAMIFCTKPKHKALGSQDKDVKLKICNNDLEVVKKIKYLGVKINWSLDWKQQIKAVSSKVSGQ